MGDYLKLDDINKALAEADAVDSSEGAGDAGKIIKLNEDGELDDTMLPSSVGAETTVAPASEALAANDVVNIWDDSGTRKVRKADASDATKPAHGYVKASVEQGANATVYTDGFLPGTGLTIGSTYFLSETAGQVTTTPPTTTGTVWQEIGDAISATAIKFDPEKPIVRS